MNDPRALRILFDTFWTPAGWRSAPAIAPEEYDYACAAGYMFAPSRATHAEVVRLAMLHRDAVTPLGVGAAFVASLGGRRLEIRSALGSYATLRHLAEHSFDGEYGCTTCGENADEFEYDRNVYNFERFKWGGVRHQQPSYAAFDLAAFRRQPLQQPTEDDWYTLEQIIERAASQPVRATPGDLARALTGILPSNEAERRILLQLLAFAGVLQPGEQVDVQTEFVPAWRRSLPPQHKLDWQYPIAWWRGRDGVNPSALREYFGHRSAWSAI